jgi:glutathione S-transferase
MLLVIGNKNYSSWSLRPWIALKMLGVPVDDSGHEWRAVA